MVYFRNRDELNSLINALRGDTAAVSNSIENGEIKKEEEESEPTVPKDLELQIKTDGVISVSIKDKISPQIKTEGGVISDSIKDKISPQIKTEGDSIKEKISPGAESESQKVQNEADPNATKKQFGHSKKGVFLDTFLESTVEIQK